MTDGVEVFVPGRLCILGEHSDWAAEYRDINPTISYGKLSHLQQLCLKDSTLKTENKQSLLYNLIIRYDDCLCHE